MRARGRKAAAAGGSPHVGESSIEASGVLQAALDGSFDVFQALLLSQSQLSCKDFNTLPLSQNLGVVHMISLHRNCDALKALVLAHPRVDLQMLTRDGQTAEGLVMARALGSAAPLQEDETFLALLREHVRYQVARQPREAGSHGDAREILEVLCTGLWAASQQSTPSLSLSLSEAPSLPLSLSPSPFLSLPPSLSPSPAHPGHVSIWTTRLGAHTPWSTMHVTSLSAFSESLSSLGDAPLDEPCASFRMLPSQSSCRPTRSPSQAGEGKTRRMLLSESLPLLPLRPMPSRLLMTDACVLPHLSSANGFASTASCQQDTETRCSRCPPLAGFGAKEA